MNNTFVLKRFGRYFRHDLASVRDNFGLTLLIAGLLPVIVWFFTQTVHRICSGTWVDDGRPSQIMAFVTSYLIMMLSYPSKVYGSLTERSAGSQWILLPASAFEKWLSMILISCVVMPVVWSVLLLGSDMLMSLTPGYGKSAAYYIFIGNANHVRLNVFKVLCLEWLCNILAWLLGAIWFKRGKVSKTFLVLIGVGFVISILSVLLVGYAHIGFDTGIYYDDIGDYISKANLQLYIICWSWISVMLVLTYLRVRTIRH